MLSLNLISSGNQNIKKYPQIFTFSSLSYNIVVSRYTSGQNQSEGVRFLLIRHSKFHYDTAIWEYFEGIA